MPSHDRRAEEAPTSTRTIDDECLTCGELDGAEGECPNPKRPCGHHCNCSWIHDCCHWCGAEMEEEGEYQVGAVVAYVKNGELHLAWREPCANQQNDHRWHVFHGMSFGWRTWSEIKKTEHVRFLGIHALTPTAESEQTTPVSDVPLGAEPS